MRRFLAAVSGVIVLLGAMSPSVLADDIFGWNIALSAGHQIVEGYYETVSVGFDTLGLFGPTIGILSESCIPGGGDPFSCSVTGFSYDRTGVSISFSGGALAPSGWIDTSGAFFGRPPNGMISGPGSYFLEDASYPIPTGSANITDLGPGPTPEPSSLLLFTVGLAALALVCRRRFA